MAQLWRTKPQQDAGDERGTDLAGSDIFQARADPGVTPSAISKLRELAHGLLPPALTRGGLSSYTTALVVAIVMVMLELGTLAFLRMRFFKTSFATSLLNVALTGVIIVGTSAALGPAAS